MRALLLAIVLAGCGTPYTARPPLPFAELPYTSLAGAPWPERALVLEGTAAELGLPRAPRLVYVELNPGGAQTVLLLHGLGSYLKFWRYQLDELAGQGYRVVAIDLPGYGKSDKPASFPYTMESFAAVVREVIDELGLGQPVLVGHSMGGHIALTFALLHPGAARALVLASPAGFEAFSARERAWFARAVRSELFVAATEEDIWASVRGANFMRWRDELRWLVEERVRVRTTPDFPAYAYANALSVRGLSHTGFVRANLGAIAAPTLIIYGSDDRLIPSPFMHGGRTSAIMEEGHRGLPASELVALSGCGHAVQLDCPRGFNRAMAAFLARQAPAGP
jgi:pimeloyl-ACP methyl ester carboxylesterase